MRSDLTNLSDAYAALAIQGPRAPEVFSKHFSLPWEQRRNRIAELGDDLARGGNRRFRRYASLVHCNHRLHRRSWDLRSSFPRMKRLGIWDSLVASGAKPCGLGARDTLRLEMCYPLNGSDLSSSHTPLEAGLGAFVDLDKERFTGRDVLVRAKGERHREKARRNPRSREVASDPSALPRCSVNGEKVGETTSGALSPTSAAESLLAILPFPLAKIGQDLEIEVRGRRYRACVVKKPFYKPRS